jgi:hypothetical protein
MFSVCQLLSHKWKVCHDSYPYSFCVTHVNTLRVRCLESIDAVSARKELIELQHLIFSEDLPCCCAEQEMWRVVNPRHRNGEALPLLLAHTTVVGSRYRVVKTLSFSLLCDVRKLTAAHFGDPVLFIWPMLQIPNTLSLTNITPKYSRSLNIYIF